MDDSFVDNEKGNLDAQKNQTNISNQNRTEHTKMGLIMNVFYTHSVRNGTQLSDVFCREFSNKHHRKCCFCTVSHWLAAAVALLCAPNQFIAVKNVLIIR